MKPTVVALYSAKPGMGKSTVANWLVKERGFVRIPFGQPLKRMCRTLFEALGHGPNEIYLFENGDKTQMIQDAGQTVRHVYQSLGTEWGRNLIHPDLWVRAWTHTVLSEIVKGATKIVADDCRYLNELQAVKHLDGKLYEVWREVDVEQKVLQHSSEGQLTGRSDVVILNDYTVEDLYRFLPDLFPLERDPVRYSAAVAASADFNRVLAMSDVPAPPAQPDGAVTDAMVEAAQTAFFASAHEPNGMHDLRGAWEAALAAAIAASKETP